MMGPGIPSPVVGIYENPTPANGIYARPGLKSHFGHPVPSQSHPNNLIIPIPSPLIFLFPLELFQVFGA